MVPNNLAVSLHGSMYCYERRHRARWRDLRVCSGFLQYLKDPTISPILTSTLIAAGTVSFNLVAGLVTEKKRADLTLEVVYTLCLR